MIIFGSRTKILNSYDNRSVGDCDYCQSRQSVSVYKQIKYAHIFWIPMFPYGSNIMTACTHCKKVNYQREINPVMLENIRNKGLPKTSIGYYAGLLLLALIIGAAGVAGISDSKKRNAYLQSPQVGDLYEIKYNVSGQARYTLYRLTDLTADSIRFEINDYEVERSSGLHKLRKQHRDSYSEDVMISKGDIAKMKKDGHILGIIR